MEWDARRLLQPRAREAVMGDWATGLVFTAGPGTRYASSDDSVRLYLCFSGKLVRRRLEVLSDGQRVDSVAFQPAFDQTHGPGATIRHMIDFRFVEWARSDSLLANETTRRTFKDNLILYLLLGLRHSHTERLQQLIAAFAPGNVKRAEEFMHVNTGAPLTIVEIAQAAGCSVRALQVAFHQFRARRQWRPCGGSVKEARTEILRARHTESITRIAADHGFSNPSRFAQLFRRTYGTYPFEALRTRSGLDQEGEPFRTIDDAAA